MAAISVQSQGPDSSTTVLTMPPVAHKLESKIRSAIVSSLRQLSDGDEARQELVSDGIRELVDEMAVENEKALLELEREGKPKSAILNSPNIVHFALLIDADEETLKLLARAVASPAAAKCFPHSGIWKPYSIALCSFLSNRLAELSPYKAKGYEKHIFPYMKFMVASSQEDRQLVRQEIADSFEARNRDRRCRDWYGLDGDGEQPVKWDFRLFTLETQLPSA